MPDVLESILYDRRKQIEKDKKDIPFSSLEARLSKVSPRGFLSAISSARGIALIAEMKRQSPSAGEIRANFDPAQIASAYTKGGATAISVLTEPTRFRGHAEDVKAVRTASNCPILWKDFVFDPYQIVLARVTGSDAILLIADMLEPAIL